MPWTQRDADAAETADTRAVPTAIIARTLLHLHDRAISFASLLSSLVDGLSDRSERVLADSAVLIGRAPGGPRQPVDTVDLLHLVIVDGALAGAIDLAHLELRRSDIDLAVAAGLDEDGRPTAVALVREADAIAYGEPVLHVVGRDAGSGPGPASHGPGAGPGAGDRLLLWSGSDEDDERTVRADVLQLLLNTAPDEIPGLPVLIPPDIAPGTVRAAAQGTARELPAAIESATAVPGTAPRPVIMLLPGQGSQYAGMARGLYEHDPVFTAAMDGTLLVMGGEGRRIRSDWLAGEDANLPIDDTRRSQPLIFAVDLAIARMLISWGVHPAGLLGHSAGELVAGVLAGVFSVRDAARTMLERVAGADQGVVGGMLAVAAAPDDLIPFLGHPLVTVAAVNGVRQTMIAGPTAPLAQAAAALEAAAFTVRTVPATHPFHSPAMAGPAAQAELALSRLDLRPPRTPIWSGYTQGRQMSGGQATSPEFWAQQIVRSVDFLSALNAVSETGGHALVECGAGQTLSSFARRHRDVRRKKHVVVSVLPAGPGAPSADRAAARAAFAVLWTEGHDLDPNAVAGL